MESKSQALEEGALQDKKSAYEDSAAIVRRWKLECSLADKREKSWRKSANTARKVYRGEKKGQDSFNILWANTEVVRPNLYNSTPQPDVRRRYRDADPVGKQVALVLERALAFESDFCGLDRVMDSAVFDSVLPGRGTARVRFEPYEEDGNYTSAKVYPEKVSWDSYTLGPADCWENVPWLKYDHEMTKDEIKDKFPGFENKVQYDIEIKNGDESAENIEPNVFVRCRVWEIWDKDKKQILWIAPSYEEKPLLVEDDKLGLRGFFDMPCPMYAVEDTSSMVPVCEYSLYEDQAKELNRVTKRINRLVEALKVRGVYDATLTELQTLMQSDDNDMVPTLDSTVALQAGGFDRAIWLMPIEEIAKVLAQLYVQREQIKVTIYEIVGISDILRGSSDPRETLGAQELKTQTGSVRLQRRQRDVQRFGMDLFNIMAEIMAEHYPPELLTVMTGIRVDDHMLDVMRRDLMRGIRVDVETDSTIAADQARVRKDVAEIMEGVGGFAQAFGPIVEAGVVGIEPAKKVFISLVRKARLGREVEEALEQEAQAPPVQRPDPEMAKVQGEQKIAEQERANEHQLAMTKQLADIEKEAAEFKNNATKQAEQQRQKHIETMAKIEADKQAAIVKSNNDAALAKLKADADIALKREVELLKIAAQVYLGQLKASNEAAKTDNVAGEGADGEGGAMVLAPLIETLKGMADAFTKPRKIKTPDGREYTATVQ